MFTVFLNPNVIVRVCASPVAFSYGIETLSPVASSGCIEYDSGSLVLYHNLKIPVGILPKFPSGNLILIPLLFKFSIEYKFLVPKV